MSSILASQIGNASTLPGWPTNDLDGLFEALKRWPLDRRLDYSNDPQFAGEPGRAPFRGRAWGFCVLQYDAKLEWPEIAQLEKECSAIIFGVARADEPDTDASEMEKAS